MPTYKYAAAPKTTDDLLNAFEEWRELNYDLNEGLFGIKADDVARSRKYFADMLEDIIDNRVKAILASDKITITEI